MSIKNYLDKFFYQRIRNEIYPITKISPITTKIGWITTYIYKVYCKYIQNVFL